VIRIEWTTDAGELVATEPTPTEVALYAAELATGYNEPANAALMGHDEPMDPGEVIEHFAEMTAEGARTFLLFRDGALVGDADLRHFHDGAAEFAFMIGARNVQGKGLGTRFATMIYASGFAVLHLARIYASLVPQNAASKRVFEKLGCVLDDGDEARSFADEPGDIVLGIDRAKFETQHATALSAIRISG
jgi:RimJ/RimL family protein N-acetyltransferase